MSSISYSSVSALNNVVASKYAAQGKVLIRKINASIWYEDDGPA